MFRRVFFCIGACRPLLAARRLSLWIFGKISGSPSRAHSRARKRNTDWRRTGAPDQKPPCIRRLMRGKPLS